MSAVHALANIENQAVLLAGGTRYFEFPIAGAEYLSIQIVWHDAVSIFVATMETTNQDEDKVADNSTNLAHWSPESSLLFSYPAGGAIGSSMKHIGNMCAKRARIKIVPAANSLLSIYVHGKS